MSDRLATSRCADIDGAIGGCYKAPRVPTMTSARLDDDLIQALRARVQAPTRRTERGDGPTTPLASPVTPEILSSTEASLGFSLHPFLQRLYREVANGGFGPGYGLLGLHEADGSLLSTYTAFRQGGSWPDQLLPLWDWGDAVWSCIDNRSHERQMVTHDDVDGATETAFTIQSWISAWLDGVRLWGEMYEDVEATIINPFTWRPVATMVRGRAKGRRWSRQDS